MMIGRDRGMNRSMLKHQSVETPKQTVGQADASVPSMP